MLNSFQKYLSINLLNWRKQNYSCSVVQGAFVCKSLLNTLFFHFLNFKLVWTEKIYHTQKTLFRSVLKPTTEVVKNHSPRIVFSTLYFRNVMKRCLPYITYIMPACICNSISYTWYLLQFFQSTKDIKSYYKIKCVFLFDLYHLFQCRFLNKSSVEEIEEMSGENIRSL